VCTVALDAAGITYDNIVGAKDREQIDGDWLRVDRILADLKDVHQAQHDGAATRIQRLHRDDAHVCREILQ